MLSSRLRGAKTCKTWHNVGWVPQAIWVGQEDRVGVGKLIFPMFPRFATMNCNMMDGWGSIRCGASCGWFSTSSMSKRNFALHWHCCVGHVHGSSQGGIVFSEVLFWVLAFIKLKHLVLLLLVNVLCDSQFALLCPSILILWMYHFGHVRSRCGHVSIDWAWHLRD
jgi:hypothetical protein